jgi:hypothetical protein
MRKKVENDMKKPSTARTVAYAAFTSAIASSLLAAGYYLQLMEFFWYFMAALCIMAALTVGGIKTALMAYAVSVMLSLLLCAFNFFFLLPYILFMGPHPIVNAVFKKHRFNAVAGHLIKAVWFCAWVYVMIRFTALFLFADLGAGGLILLIVAAISLPAYALYDLAVRIVSGHLNIRLRRITSGGV